MLAGSGDCPHANGAHPAQELEVNEPQGEVRSVTLPASGYEPRWGSLGEANRRFHDEYDRALERTKLRFGNEIPVLLVSGGKLITFWRGSRDEQLIHPPMYHKLKAISHQVVATWLRGERLAERALTAADRAALLEQQAILEQSAEELRGPEFKDVCLPETRLLLEASRHFVFEALTNGRISATDLKRYAQVVGPVFKQLTSQPAEAVIDALHQHVERLREKMSCDEWADLHVVCSGSRQARAGDVTAQYFSRLFGEYPGEGASREDKLLFVENVYTETELFSMLARHIVDSELGEAFFGNAFALQRDVMADAAAEYLDSVFGASH